MTAVVGGVPGVVVLSGVLGGVAIGAALVLAAVLGMAAVLARRPRIAACFCRWPYYAIGACISQRACDAAFRRRTRTDSPMRRDRIAYIDRPVFAGCSGRSSTCVSARDTPRTLDVRPTPTRSSKRYTARWLCAPYVLRPSCSPINGASI
jgi:hypothetical protein